MKKITACLLLTSLLLCGCGEKKSAHTETAETVTIHQELEALTAEFNSGTDMRVDIPQLGLTNVAIGACSNHAQLGAETWGRACLVYDDRFGTKDFADYYLLVIAGSKIVARDLQTEDALGALDASVELADVDGDGDCEFLVQETVAASGGAGQYRSRVYDLRDGQLEELFISVPGEKMMDTGFSVTLQLGQRYEIYNQATDYRQAFVLTDRTEAYFDRWYNEDGTVAEYDLWVDSFCRFDPVDVDGDGTYEIECVQYTCLMDHTDFVGWAHTIIKYDEIAGEFRIMDAWFTQN